MSLGLPVLKNKVGYQNATKSLRNPQLGLFGLQQAQLARRTAWLLFTAEPLGESANVDAADIDDWRSPNESEPELVLVWISLSLGENGAKEQNH